MNDREEKMNDLLEKGWIKVWMIFEVQATDRKVCENALKRHIGALGKDKSIEIVEESFADVDEIDVPEGLKQRGVEALFTQVSEVTLMVADYEILMNAVITFAPTAVEIIEPEKIVLSMRQAQNTLANVADMMHRFARAGIGGMVIKGD